MDRLLSSGDECNELHGADGAISDRFHSVGTTDQSFLEGDIATHLASHPLRARSEGTRESPPVPRTLNGRADIDTAMVEALNCAMASDRGPPGAQWDSPDRTTFGDMGRSIDLGSSRWGPPELPRRGDIDVAMLDALRLAMGPDPEVPGA